MKVKTKYYFAKVNINWNIFTASKSLKYMIQEALPRLILNFDNKSFYNVYYKDNRSKWGIKNISKIKVGIIKGDLVRISNVDYNTVQGPKTVSKTVNDAYRAQFYYFIDSEILVFQKTSKISCSQFINMFSNILLKSDKKTNNEVGPVDIELLTQVSEFKKQIIQAPQIVKLHLNLIAPNNPRTTNSIANILTKSKSQKTSMTFNNKNGGLHFKNKSGRLNKFFQDVLDMFSDGWGSGTAKDSKGNIISSKKHPITTNKIDSSKDNSKLLKNEVKRIEDEKKKREVRGRKSNSNNGN